MTLSGLRSLDKSAIVGLLFVVSDKRDPQGRKLLVGFEPTKAFLCFAMHCETTNSPGLRICFRAAPARLVAIANWAIVFSSMR